jgi:hypothetical protein
LEAWGGVAILTIRFWELNLFDWPGFSDTISRSRQVIWVEAVMSYGRHALVPEREKEEEKQQKILRTDIRKTF